MGFVFFESLNYNINSFNLTPTRGHGFSRVPKVRLTDTRSCSQVAKQESIECESDPEELTVRGTKGAYG